MTTKNGVEDLWPGGGGGVAQCPNKIPALPPPHPGQSANPALRPHQEALAIAARALGQRQRAHNNFVHWFATGHKPNTAHSALCSVESKINNETVQSKINNETVQSEINNETVELKLNEM